MCAVPTMADLGREAALAASDVSGALSISSPAHNSMLSSLNKLPAVASNEDCAPQPVQQLPTRSSWSLQPGKQNRQSSAQGVRLGSAGRLAQHVQHAAAPNRVSDCCLADIVGTALGHSHSTNRQPSRPLQSSSTPANRQKASAAGRLKLRSSPAKGFCNTLQPDGQQVQYTAQALQVMGVQNACSASKHQLLAKEVTADLQLRPEAKGIDEVGHCANQTAMMGKPPCSARSGMQLPQSLSFEAAGISFRQLQ